MCVLTHTVSTNNVVVTMNDNSKVQGIKQKSYTKGRDFYAFIGVHYGKAPVGERRFKVKYKIMIKILLNIYKYPYT